MQGQNVTNLTLALALSGTLVAASGVEAGRIQLPQGQVAVLPVTAPRTLLVETTILNELSSLFGRELLKRGARVQSTAAVREVLLNQDLSLDLMVKAGRNLAIGEAVGARYLLKATILEYEEFVIFEHDGVVALTAQLIDARTGETLWSGSGSKIIYWVDEKSLVVHMSRIISRMMGDIAFDASPRTGGR